MLCISENETFGDDDRARAIENREPCQMGNQAAISGAFDVLWIPRSEPFFLFMLRRCVLWHIRRFTGNGDRLCLRI